MRGLLEAEEFPRSCHLYLQICEDVDGTFAAALVAQVHHDFVMLSCFLPSAQNIESFR